MVPGARRGFAPEPGGRTGGHGAGPAIGVGPRRGNRFDR